MRIDDFFLSGFFVGFPLFTILSMSFMLFCSPQRSRISNVSVKDRKVKSSLPCNYVLNTRVSAMDKFICKLSLVELETATNNFDRKNVIGYGNTGVTYKAVFSNGLLFAVKRLRRFESFKKKFLTEIEILGRLGHSNIAPLVGFCFEMEKKILVYKYMCNGTLHYWLHCMEARKIEWALRLKIAVGIARGLAWLHHNNVLRIAHLKINSKCILLDENFEPKISNFGDAMILMNASTCARPSSGCNFVVPDSSTYKEDVYSFGILLVELITGGKPPSTRINSLTDHVIVVDECLMRQGFTEEIYETYRIAESCIRPKKGDATSMLQVYKKMRLIGISRNEIPVTIHSDEHIEEGYLDLTV